MRRANSGSERGDILRLGAQAKNGGETMAYRLDATPYHRRSSVHLSQFLNFDVPGAS